MKYLNKNIEEIGKVSSEKSLIHHTTSCGVFKNAEFHSPKVKDCLQSSRNIFN